MKSHDLMINFAHFALFPMKIGAIFKVERRGLENILDVVLFFVANANVKKVDFLSAVPQYLLIEQTESSTGFLNYIP